MSWQHPDIDQQHNPPPFCLFLSFKRHFLLFLPVARYSSVEPALYTVPVQLQGRLVGNFAQKKPGPAALASRTIKITTEEWSTNKDG
ncbi:hypothetical protein [Pseudomonas helleri]|uniref:Uncharacterized protein n=1 Tax=Pseudomonas helleri TaxID=1608996 RepID=A0A7X2C4T7_9PSED|nr:hypothetical protein [Pseudomonas helleri]MQT49160.1 hypothetical protein [Pseudomonas helleri]MQT90860.1 hypothetical protein [Pseudomonas helleri]